MLVSCGSPQLTKSDALNKSYLYGVKCNTVVKHDRQPKIYIVGKEINKYCGGAVACYKPYYEAIYTQHDDWRAVNHELLHHYCDNPTHVTYVKTKTIEQKARVIK